MEANVTVVNKDNTIYGDFIMFAKHLSVGENIYIYPSDKNSHDTVKQLVVANIWDIENRCFVQKTEKDEGCYNIKAQLIREEIVKNV